MQKQATKIRNTLKKKPRKIKKTLSLNLDVESREGTINVRKKRLHAKLVDLPTITESYKTTDKTNLFKTANVSQMLICSKYTPKEINEDDPQAFKHTHGLTPPLKNVKKCRFRKTLKNSNDVIEAEDVEKEVLLLLRADNEAVRALCFK